MMIDHLKWMRNRQVKQVASQNGDQGFVQLAGNHDYSNLRLKFADQPHWTIFVSI